MINRILLFFEKQAFGVMEWWGEKLGIDSSKLRLFFIYLSFITLGSPLILYLIMAFILEQRKKYKRKRRTVWDL